MKIDILLYVYVQNKKDEKIEQFYMYFSQFCNMSYFHV